MAHDVFISYSHNDKAAADAVCAKLEQRQVRCWIAPRDIVPGAEWAGSIIRAINNARVMVLVLSAKANDSPQINKEVERAVNKGVIVVPLRIEDVVPTESLEFFIGNVHWLDALTPPLEKHLDRLADIVTTLLSQMERIPRSVQPAVPQPTAPPVQPMEASIVPKSALQHFTPAAAAPSVEVSLPRSPIPETPPATSEEESVLVPPDRPNARDATQPAPEFVIPTVSTVPTPKPEPSQPPRKSLRARRFARICFIIGEPLFAGAIVILGAVYFFSFVAAQNGLGLLADQLVRIMPVPLGGAAIGLALLLIGLLASVQAYFNNEPRLSRAQSPPKQRVRAWLKRIGELCCWLGALLGSAAPLAPWRNGPAFLESGMLFLITGCFILLLELARWNANRLRFEPRPRHVNSRSSWKRGWVLAQVFLAVTLIWVSALAVQRAIHPWDPPSSIRPFLKGAADDASKKDGNSATTALQDALRIDTNYRLAHDYLAWVLAQEGNATGAIKAFSVPDLPASIDQPYSVYPDDWLYSSGDSRVASLLKEDTEDSLKGAATECRKIPESQIISDYGALVNCAIAITNVPEPSNQSWTDAKRYLREAIGMGEKNGWKPDAAYFDLAEILASSDPGESIQLLERYVSSSSSDGVNGFARMQLGTLFAVEGDYQKAIDEFRFAVKLTRGSSSDNDQDNWKDFADVYLQAALEKAADGLATKRQWAPALNLLDEAGNFKNSPISREWELFALWCAAQAGQFAEAEAKALNIIGNDQENPSPEDYFWLSVVTRDRVRAQEACRRALFLAPHDPWLQWMLKRSGA